MANAPRVKKGDQVVVISGKDKGKHGEVLRMMRKEMRAIVQGVNVAIKHMRPSATAAGGIVEKELSIHVSNLAHVDPKTQQPTRVGYRFLEDGRKVRFAKRSSEIIDT